MFPPATGGVMPTRCYICDENCLSSLVYECIKNLPPEEVCEALKDVFGSKEELIRAVTKRFKFVEILNIQQPNEPEKTRFLGRKQPLPSKVYIEKLCSYVRNNMSNAPSSFGRTLLLRCLLMFSKKRHYILHNLLERLKGSITADKIQTERIRRKPVSHESAQDAQLDLKPIVFHPVENFARFLLVPIPSSCAPNIYSKGRKATARREDKSYASVGKSESSKNVVRPKAEVQPTTSERNRSRSIAAQRPVQISLRRLAAAMRKAFSGLPLTYVPLEEQNVYANSYSVFVLYERQVDERLCPNRVIHTDDTQQWLAHCEGTVEHRRIHFLNIAPRDQAGKCEKREATDFLEHLNQTWLTGHAGSVRTLWLDSLRGFLISGSYDTTIRLWDLSENIVHLQRPKTNKQEADSSAQKAEDPMSFHTGQSRCVCKYRGHSANVLCLWVDQSRVWPRVQPPKKRQHQRAGETDAVLAFFDNLTFRFASGGADNTCYVWQMDSRVPLWMMKHSTSVTAVVLCGYWCASGDQSGEIKLWDLRDESPLLHKVLQGHTDEITALRMNEAYLVSSSKDGFVRVWDLVSKLTTCLGQLAHLSPVLCMELRFLRILTGCADGRVRMWNLLTQNCQRVFLGNNRHDPILSLLAFDNRIILNTQHNVLDLQFNQSVWSFSRNRDAVAEVPWTGPTLPRTDESPTGGTSSRAEIRCNRIGITKGTDLRVTGPNEHSFTSSVRRKPKIIRRGNSGQKLQSLSSPRAIHASNSEARFGNCRSKSL